MTDLLIKGATAFVWLYVIIMATSALALGALFVYAWRQVVRDRAKNDEIWRSIKRDERFR